MIRLIETFDNDTTIDSLTDRGWKFAGGMFDPPNSILPGYGRFGTNAWKATNSNTRIPLENDATRLIVGFAVSITTGWVSGQRIGVVFRNSNTDLVWDGVPHFSIIGVYDYTTGIMSFTLSTGAEYPTIPIQTGNCPNIDTDYCFIEFYVDSSPNHNGNVKIAINGVTCCDLWGIATLAYNVYGDDPYSILAKYNEIEMVTAISYDSYHGYNSVGILPPFNLIDTIYICDEAGGYQNDFLGPIYTKSVYPTNRGNKSNWSPYVNSVQVEGGTNHEKIDGPIVHDNESSYIEADQDLQDEMFTFAPEPVPIGSTLIAVNHRTMFRNVAVVGNPPANTLVPEYQIIGNDPVITNAKAKKMIGWDYGFLDIYYNIVPGFAIPWTENLLEQSQFGFIMREPTWTGVLRGVVEFNDWSNHWSFWNELITEVLMLDGSCNENFDGINTWDWDENILDIMFITEEPDYGDFLIDDSHAMIDTLSGELLHLSNVCTGGTASASSFYNETYSPDMAFNGDGGFWLSAYFVAPYWLRYDLASGVSKTAAAYELRLNSSYYCTSTWQFQGWSASEGAWITLDEQVNFNFPYNNDYVVQFPLSFNPKLFTKFRIYFTACSYQAVEELRVLELTTVGMG